MPNIWHGSLLGLVLLSWVYWIVVTITVAIFFGRKARPEREGCRFPVSLDPVLPILERILFIWLVLVGSRLVETA